MVFSEVPMMSIFTNIKLFTLLMILSLLLFFLNYKSIYSFNEKTILTNRQMKYKKFLNSKNIHVVISLGPAGTGKTWIASEYAIEKIKNKEIDKVILTRPMVTIEGEDIGFLPGKIDEKFSPYTHQIFEYFKSHFSQKEIETMIQFGIIESTPIGFLRGRSFENTLIIADEMQNSSPKQILMLLTRLGYNSKMIICGDLSQCDLPIERVNCNGLSNLLENLKNYFNSFHEMLNVGIALIEFDVNDCKRSPFVRKVIEIYSTSNVTVRNEI